MGFPRMGEEIFNKGKEARRPLLTLPILLAFRGQGLRAHLRLARRGHRAEPRSYRRPVGAAKHIGRE